MPNVLGSGRLLEPHLTEVLTRTQAAKETASRFLRLDSAQLRLGVMRTIGPVRFVRAIEPEAACNSALVTTGSGNADDFRSLSAKYSPAPFAGGSTTIRVRFPNANSPWSG